MAKPKFLSENGLQYVITYIKNLLGKKVDKEVGKGLSTNDYSNTEKEKLNNIEAGAQSNVIDTIKINGVVQAVDNKAVDLDIATGLEDRLAASNTAGGIIMNSIDGNYANTVTGNFATATGYDTTASGLASFAAGSGTTANGAQTFAQGSETTSTGTSSHAEGSNSTSQGAYSHAEGDTTISTGVSSHSEGQGTRSTGDLSHAEGLGTTSVGKASHSEGLGTQTTHAYQHVFGSYNVYDASQNEPTEKGTYVEIVGVGTANNSRANGRTLDWNGNETLAGKLTVGVAPVNDMDVTTKKYVDDFIDSLTESIEGITGFEFEVVQELPQSGESGIIYLVAHSHDTDDGYDEYIWINNGFEKLGHADVDLSGYVETTDIITNNQIDAMFNA